MIYENWAAVLEERFPPLGEAAWREAKQALHANQQVVGVVVVRAHFGAWVDIGIGFPALLEVPHISGLTHEVYQSGVWCPIGSSVSARVADFVDRNHQVRLWQVNPALLWPKSGM